jgi:hypothetical protein
MAIGVLKYEKIENTGIIYKILLIHTYTKNYMKNK